MEGELAKFILLPNRMSGVQEHLLLPDCETGNPAVRGLRCFSIIPKGNFIQFSGPNPVHMNVVTPKDESGRKHVSPTAVELLSLTAEGAGDALLPLKSAIGGLCAILDNFEVFSTVVNRFSPHHSRSKQRRTWSDLDTGLKLLPTHSAYPFLTPAKKG